MQGRQSQTFYNISINYHAPEELEPTNDEEAYEHTRDPAELGNVNLEGFNCELLSAAELSSKIPANETSHELDSYPLDDRSSQSGAQYSIHQDTVGMNATCSGTYMPFNMVPAHTGLVLPPGLFPTAPKVNYHSPHSVQSSMFSEHVEALELQARCKLDAAPDAISR